jgi:hypothetical protein
MATKPSNKQMEAAKQGVKQYLATVKVMPEILVMAGQMAEAVIKDKALYPMFRQQVINNKLVEPDDLDKKIDYPSLAVFATMGKITEKMLSTGELGGA